MYTQHRNSISARKVDFNDVWERLLETITGVITCGEVARSTWTDRIADVYKLCTALPVSFSERLYLEIKSYLETYVKATRTEVKEDEEYLLDVYHLRWEKYFRGASFLNQLFKYLNMTFIRKNKYNDGEVNDAGMAVDSNDDYMEIGELALDIWNKHMIQPLKNRLRTLLLQEIADHRLSNPVNDAAVVRGVIFSLVDVMKYKKKLQLYDEMFETPLVKETRKHYKRIAEQLKAECTLSEYMEKVIQLLEAEEARCRQFLHPTSFDTIMQECEELLVEDHFWYLVSESHSMVRHEDKKDVKNLFYLLHLIDRGLGILQHDVEQSVKEAGIEAIRNLPTENMAVHFVEALFGVYNHYAGFIQKVFDSDEIFTEPLDKGMTAAVNARIDPNAPCPSPALLAQCFNHWLKKSTEVASEEERESRLSECLLLHKYLEDKEAFKQVYSYLLAERIVNSEMVSKKSEETMVNKLKVLSCLRLLSMPREMLMRRLSESPGDLMPQKVQSAKATQQRRFARNMQHNLLFSYRQTCFCGKKKCTANCKPGSKKAEKERRNSAQAGGLTRQNSAPADTGVGQDNFGRHSSDPVMFTSFDGTEKMEQADAATGEKNQDEGGAEQSNKPTRLSITLEHRDDSVQDVELEEACPSADDPGRAVFNFEGAQAEEQAKGSEDQSSMVAGAS